MFIDVMTLHHDNYKVITLFRHYILGKRDVSITFFRSGKHRCGLCGRESRIALLVSAAGISGLERSVTFGTMRLDLYRVVDLSLSAFVYTVPFDLSVFFPGHTVLL
jgi:hypothetical protein